MRNELRRNLLPAASARQAFTLIELQASQCITFANRLAAVNGTIAMAK